MSFCRNRERELEWREWVAKSQERLIAIGIPREVLSDCMNWWRFLEHGIHLDCNNSRDVRFRLEDLNERQQRQFFEFLRESLSNRERIGNVVWTVLHHRCEPPGEPSYQWPEDNS